MCTWAWATNNVIEEWHQCYNNGSINYRCKLGFKAWLFQDMISLFVSYFCDRSCTFPWSEKDCSSSYMIMSIDLLYRTYYRTTTSATPSNQLFACFYLVISIWYRKAHRATGSLGRASVFASQTTSRSNSVQDLGQISKTSWLPWRRYGAAKSL